MAPRSASLLLMLALALLGAEPQASVRAADIQAETATGSLVGQFLVAAPQMSDPRFSRTVIYMVSHSGEGAMGLVVNRDIGRGPLRALLSGFGIRRSRGNRSITLHYGGPVEQNRGFVLHSDDYAGPNTHRIGGDLALSTGRDVLEAVADGKGPRRSLFLIGYAGWGPGQLEGELAREDWLVAPADDRLIFAEDPAAEIWQRAYSHAGMPL
jgi:putative transcriptional regulator